MKRALILMAATGLAVSMPASAGDKPRLFATWEACFSAGAASDTWKSWDFECVEQPSGRWALVWINVMKRQK